MSAIGRLQQAGVDHDVGVQRQDLLDVTCCGYPRLRSTNYDAGVLPRLGFGVDVESGELHVRVVEYGAQDRLAHGAGGPLHDAVGHQPRASRSPLTQVAWKPLGTRSGIRIFAIGPLPTSLASKMTTNEASLRSSHMKPTR